MKERIKYYFYIIKNLFNSKNFFYLALSIIAITYFCVSNTVKEYGFSYNLVFDLNFNWYLLLIIITIIFFLFQILNNLKTRCELVTRFYCKEDFFKFVFGSVVFLITFIYLFSLILLLLFRVFKHMFIFDTDLFYFYNIPAFLYFFWQIIRNYIFILFISFIITFINVYCDNKLILFIVLCFSLITFVVPYNNVHYIFFSSFLDLNDYGSLINEMACFVMIYILKYFLFIMVMNLINNSWMIFFKKIKIYIFRFLNIIKKICFPLIVYIVINLINVCYLNSQNIIIEDFEIIGTSNYDNLLIVSFASKAVSLASFIFILDKILYVYLNQNSCIIFTRLSKRRFIINKIICFLVIICFLRLPLYLYSGLSLSILYDLVICLILMIATIIQALNPNVVNIGNLVVILLLSTLSIYSLELILLLILLSIIAIFINVFLKERIDKIM